MYNLRVFSIKWAVIVLTLNAQYNFNVYRLCLNSDLLERRIKTRQDSLFSKLIEKT